MEFIDRDEPIAAFVGGQGAGKSHVGCYDLLRRALPGRLYTITAPTYPMLADATFRSFRSIAERLNQWLPGGHNRTHFVVTFRTWRRGTAEVLFRSTDDPDRLRGPNLSGVFMDEASLTRHEAFQILLARLREGGQMGWLRAAFTPKGRAHWTYQVFGKGGLGVKLIHARTADNPFLSEEFLETVASQYGGLRAMQELEGQFVDVAGAEWPADYFPPSIWFEEWPRTIMQRFIALDPSKGKDARKGDYSAYVMLGLDGSGLLYVEADLQRRPTPQMVADGLELARRFQPDLFGVEINQYQELLIPEFDRASLVEQRLALPIVGLDNHVNKVVRIRRLGPYLARGLFRFKADSPGTELLVQQLREFPEGDHDDGADSLEMALRLCNEMQAATAED